MDSIIFCGKCGAFIPEKELTSGKVFKVDNIYYCSKCAAGTVQRVQPKIPLMTAVSSPAVNRPAPKPMPRPAITAKPPVPPSAPAMQQPRQPVARPAAQNIVRRAPIQPAPKAPPVVQRPAVSQAPAPTRYSAPSIRARMLNVPAAPVPETRRSPFTPAPAKKSYAKIYLITGAVLIAIIIVYAVMTSMANKAAKEEEAKRQETARKYFQQIKDEDNDQEENPQAVLKLIKELSEFLVGTNYEAKITPIKESAQKRIELLEKIRELDSSPPEKQEAIETTLAQYKKVRSEANSNSYSKIASKLNDTITVLSNKLKKIKEEEEVKIQQQEDEMQKTYNDFKAKIADFKSRKAYKDMIKACDDFLSKPGTLLKYQDEVNAIKTEAEDGLKEQKEIEKRKLDWQVLSSDQSRWSRTGGDKTEFYVDGDNSMVLNNPSKGGSECVLINNEQWQNFKMDIEFTVLSGSLDIVLRGNLAIPFKRIFGTKEELKKYTIELDKSVLTLTESGKDPIIKEVANQAGPIAIRVKPGDHIIIKLLRVKIKE